jgi:hypothetical protein
MFSAGVLPIRYSPFTIRHSLLAIRCRFTIRRSHSLLATRYSLPFSARQEPRPPIFAPPTEVGGYKNEAR